MFSIVYVLLNSLLILDWTNLAQIRNDDSKILFPTVTDMHLSISKPPFYPDSKANADE